MRSRSMYIIPLTFFAACAPAAAPADGPSPGTRMDAEVPPVRALLSERERLALTSDQVVALDSISRDWEAANAELSRRIGAVKGRRPSPFRLALGQLSPALAELSEINRRAAKAAEQVLSPRQRRTICAVQRLRVGVAEEVRAVKTAGAPRSAVDKAPRGERSGLARASRRGETRRAWPWCTAPESSTETTNSAS